MKDTIVRLESISIENFKNVRYGRLHFTNTRKDYKASILGLYGQNGSGKTALIDAIELLQYILRDQQIPAKFVDYIHVESNEAAFSYEFSVIDENIRYHAFYDFKLKMQEPVTNQNIISGIEEKIYYRPMIVEEVLSYTYEDGERKERKSRLIDTREAKVFAPLGKYYCLIGKDKEKMMDLLVAKKIALSTSKAFIFSNDLLTAIHDHTSGKDDIEYRNHLRLLESLVRYGTWELFVINTANTGIISLNMLPLVFRYEDGMNETAGSIVIPLEEAFPIPIEALTMVEQVIENMNIVLKQIVPELTIHIESLGEILLANGKKGIKMQLMSFKNAKKIPLRYESDGIKKIVSILQLLIVVYNRASITVAVDELDAGVFEYLLGELLRIISEKGKGQLIFTSHNLRPLETLDRGFIAFTTTNPSNRYIRMTNIKDSNNLRDFYFRDIMLGEQNEEVYEMTNNAEIAMAFREAGESLGS